jgi:hypothetical protein
MWAFLAPILEALGLASFMGVVRTAVVSFVAYLGANVMTNVYRGLISFGVVTAWGAFLLVITTGITGMNLITLFKQNPFDGLTGDMFQLFYAIFPFAFFVRLTVAYILWNLSFMQAALVMMRVNKYFFGG